MTKTPATALDAEPVTEHPRPVDDEPWLDHIPQAVPVLALGAVGLAVWQLVIEVGLVPQIILPTPIATFQEILRTGHSIITGGHVFDEFLVTAQEVLLGFAVAATLGFSLGVIVGETVFGRRAVMPYMIAINSMPKVAFAPVFVAWLGFGMGSKVVMSAYLALFPVIVGTAAGLRAADRDALMLFQSLGATRWQTLVKLKLPAAMPYIFAGLRTATVFSVVGAVVGEFLGGGGRGLGDLVRISAAQLRMERVFAFIVYLSAIGLTLFALMGWVQRRVVFWQEPDPTDTASA